MNKVTTTGTTAAVTGLSAGQTYYFAARACDEAGTACSAFSNEVSTTIPSTPPPLSITTASLPNGTVGRSLRHDLGGDRRHRALQLVHCERLPAQWPDLEPHHWGDHRDAHGGDDFNFTVRVTDSASPAITTSKA